MLYDPSNTSMQMGQDRQILLEIYLNKGPVFIELIQSQHGRFMIRQNMDYVRINYAVQQWVSENKHALNQKSKSVVQVNTHFNRDDFMESCIPQVKQNESFNKVMSELNFKDESEQRMTLNTQPAEPYAPFSSYNKLEKEGSRQSKNKLYDQSPIKRPKNHSVSVDNSQRSNSKRPLSSSSKNNVFNSIGLMQITYNNRPLSNTKIKFGQTPIKRDISNLSKLKARLGSNIKAKTGFPHKSDKKFNERKSNKSNSRKTLIEKNPASHYGSFDLGTRNNKSKDIYNLIENTKPTNQTYDWYMRTTSMPNVDDIEIDDNIYDVSKNSNLITGAKNSFMNKKLQMKLP